LDFDDRPRFEIATRAHETHGFGLFEPVCRDPASNMRVEFGDLNGAIQSITQICGPERQSFGSKPLRSTT
jgi:hypothetical protein